jgi:hypothetical protein
MKTSKTVKPSRLLTLKTRENEGMVPLLKQIGKFIACLLPVVLLVFSTQTAMSANRENWIDFASGGFSGGNGTVENPYRISSAGELALGSVQK